MIGDALKFILDEVKHHLGTDEVRTDHAFKLKEDAGTTGAFISLVSVEEETVLKNTNHQIYKNGQATYQEPPVHVNLYLLFSFKFTTYEKSLENLSKTIELFQSKRMFSKKNERAENKFPDMLEKLIFDFHNTDFEQLNHLWGVLGGSYLPSVLYKVRLVKIQKDDSIASPEITKIAVNTDVQ